VLLRSKKTKAVAALALLPALTGCLTHHRTVLRVDKAAVVQNATVGELVKKVNAQYDAVHSLRASVEIAASVGGSATGKVTDYTALSGYIILRKPADMRVLLLIPVLHRRAIDMVSNGTSFKMLIPPKNRAIVGTETITEPSANPLENLRPSVFLDSLLIRGVDDDELVSLTSDMQILMSADNKHATEMPDYDLNVLRRKGNSNELQTLRVIHINRTNLLPYRQDIYDEQGRLVTTADYENYQTFDGQQFPTLLTIKRPIDQYQIKMTIDNMTINPTNPGIGDDQFELKIPEGIPVQTMK